MPDRRDHHWRRHDLARPCDVPTSRRSPSSTAASTVGLRPPGFCGAFDRGLRVCYRASSSISPSRARCSAKSCSINVASGSPVLDKNVRAASIRFRLWMSSGGSSTSSKTTSPASTQPSPTSAWRDLGARGLWSRPPGNAHLQVARPEPLVRLLTESLANGRSVPTREGGFPVLRLTALKAEGVDLAERKGGDWTESDAQRYYQAWRLLRVTRCCSLPPVGWRAGNRSRTRLYT